MGGKLIFYELSRDTKEHWMFFDDNIRYDDAYIVGARPANLNIKVPFIASLLQSHILRAEPLESIGNKDYFIKQVGTLEAGFDRRVRAQANLKKCLRLVRNA